MSQQLFICEKPSQARDIAKVIGATRKSEGVLCSNNTVVTWCFGHLLMMAQPEDYDSKYQQWTLSSLPIIPDRWKLLPRKDARNQLSIIKKQLLHCSEVVIATDADREGEVIAREVLDFYRYKGPVKRLWLSALDPSSIQQALNTMLPDHKTIPLYHAGLARARADWLVGMNLTRAFSLLGRQAGYKSVFSVGRVQTPTLQLVVERDRAIESFIPSTYWDLMITVQTATGATFTAKWIAPDSVQTDEEGRCLSEQDAIDVVDIVRSATAMIDTVNSCAKQVEAPLGYDLSTLQTEASQRWGMSATQTLTVVQALYENHKLVSYPRTSCRFLPESQFDDAPHILSALVEQDDGLTDFVENADMKLKSETWNQKKVDSSAHHAIIPIANRQRCILNDDAKRIYNLICRRYIAQFYPAYEYLSTTVQIRCCSE